MTVNTSPILAMKDTRLRTFAIPCSDTFSSTWFLSPLSLRPFISYLKPINHGEIDISRKPYRCRIQWVNLKVLILNFYYYKNSNEIKLSISLCTKKSAPDFCPGSDLRRNPRICGRKSVLFLDKNQAKNYKFLYN